MMIKNSCSGIPRCRLCLVLAICGLLAAAAGCSGEHPEPPLERSELVLRFFRSVRSGDYRAAVRQGGKIHAIDKHNSTVLSLTAIQESNVYIKEAQRLLNRGDINGAVKVLADGRRTFPNNAALDNAYSKVRQLRNADKLIGTMQKARRSTSMEAALSAANIGLSAHNHAGLKKYFARYEKRIAAVRKAEEREKLRTEPLVVPAVDLPAASKSAAATPSAVPAEGSAAAGNTVANRIAAEKK